MRYLYEVETKKYGAIRQEADRLTITPNGDLSLIDVSLVSKQIKDQEIMAEEPSPTLVLAAGEWGRLVKVEKKEG